MANFTQWIKANRHKRISNLMAMLSSKLRGYWNYYGVQGNGAGLVKFYQQVRRILFRWLNRRSDRRSYTWDGFAELLRQFQIPTPSITEGRQRELWYA